MMYSTTPRYHDRLFHEKLLRQTRLRFLVSPPAFSALASFTMVLCHLLWLLSSIITVNAFCRAPPLPSYLSAEEISIDPKDYPAFRIDIPVDHYNASDQRLYKNRYWV